MLAARVGLLAGLLAGCLHGFSASPRGAVSRRVVIETPAPAPRIAAPRTHRDPLRITAAARERWTRVAICEEGGWRNAHGPTYFGSLGWLQSTWDAFRGPGFPARADEASITQQIWAAQRFAGYYHLVPDQHGCTGGY